VDDVVKEEIDKQEEEPRPQVFISIFIGTLT
jgi:hypothetical protein